MASSTGSFAGNTLHGAAITEEAVGVVRQEVEPGPIEDGAGVSLGNSETDGIGEALAERTCRDLDTWRIMTLRVTGSDAVDRLVPLKRCQRGKYRRLGLIRLLTPYSEGFEIIHGDSIAEEMKQSILEHAAVTVPVVGSTTLVQSVRVI